MIKWFLLFHVPLKLFMIHDQVIFPVSCTIKTLYDT